MRLLNVVYVIIQSVNGTSMRFQGPIAPARLHNNEQPPSGEPTRPAAAPAGPPAGGQNKRRRTGKAAFTWTHIPALWSFANVD
jgi:hypothetical protein